MRSPAASPSLEELLAQSVRQVIRDEITNAHKDLLHALSERFPARRTSSRGGGVGYISIAEAARQFDVAPGTIRRWRQRGLRTYGPRNNKIATDEFREFVRNIRRDSDSPSSKEDQADRILARARSRRVRK
jgi:transposase-like protein